MGEHYTNDRDMPICPHCGYEHQDYFEFTNGTYNCEECEGLFQCETQTITKFSTRIARCQRCDGELDIDHRHFCLACLKAMGCAIPESA